MENKQTAYKLELGHSYQCTTASNARVTPIKQLNVDSAIFATDDFGYCRFVKWWFRITGKDTIECASGTYFHTLEDALADDRCAKRPLSLILRVKYICQSCHKIETKEIAINSDTEFDTIVEELSDNSVCMNCGECVSRAIQSIVLIDNNYGGEITLIDC